MQCCFKSNFAVPCLHRLATWLWINLLFVCLFENVTLACWWHLRKFPFLLGMWNLFPQLVQLKSITNSKLEFLFKSCGKVKLGIVKVVDLLSGGVNTRKVIYQQGCNVYFMNLYSPRNIGCKYILLSLNNYITAVHDKLNKKHQIVKITDGD